MLLSCRCYLTSDLFGDSVCQVRLGIEYANTPPQIVKQCQYIRLTQDMGYIAMQLIQCSPTSLTLLHLNPTTTHLAN